MIRFVIGKPGGGKSYFALKILVDELLYGDRCVVTNLAVNMMELNQYLISQGKQIDVEDRIRILTDEETADFYRHRSKGQDLDAALGRKMFAQGADSVVFIIDEIHEFFNAREWAKTGKEVLYYLSQHRKMGDDVVCITQALGNVEKQFRSVAQEFISCRNFGNEKFAGLNIPNNTISWRTYLSPPGVGAVVTDQGILKVDIGGLAKCYDTMKGVGLMGKGKKTIRKRGFSVFWLLPAGVLVVILFWLGLHYLVPAALGKALKTDLKTSTNLLTSTSNVSTVPTVAPLPQASQVTAQAAPIEPEVFLTGRTEAGGLICYWLSDGRKLPAESVIAKGADGIATRYGRFRWATNSHK